MNAIRKVGILGLGKMGAPMAQHLIAKGYNVAGYDPVDAAQRNAKSLGVSVLDSAREVAREADASVMADAESHGVVAYADEPLRVIAFRMAETGAA